jgi:drug/metabolite transporter (DMT)-like permease
MNSSAAGIGFSIATSVFWAVSPMFMASAGRRIGSFNTNLLRALLPLAGMLCYVAALKSSPAGLVSTVVATSPLVVIPLVAVRYRAKVGAGVIVAAVVAVMGVGLISWK